MPRTCAGQCGRDGLGKKQFSAAQWRAPRPVCRPCELKPRPTEASPEPEQLAPVSAAAAPAPAVLPAGLAAPPAADDRAEHSRFEAGGGVAAEPRPPTVAAASPHPPHQSSPQSPRPDSVRVTCGDCGAPKTRGWAEGPGEPWYCVQCWEVYDGARREHTAVLELLREPHATVVTPPRAAEASKSPPKQPDATMEALEAIVDGMTSGLLTAADVAARESARAALEQLVNRWSPWCVGALRLLPSAILTPLSFSRSVRVGWAFGGRKKTRKHA